MDETEWLECVNPWAMFALVRDRLDARKQRLLACACVRSVWHHLQDERFRAMVELGEEYADGRATVEQLEGAERVASAVLRDMDFSRFLREPPLSAMAAARSVGNRTIAERFYEAMRYSLLSAAPYIPLHSFAPDPEAKKAHTRHIADLFRDIVGNPFRPVSLHPDWLAWEGGLVRRLAETMYEERRYQDLPVLADALEEAGCDEPEVLAHLRGGGGHARGCWALDLARGIV
jgi:hypothetical protein